MIIQKDHEHASQVWKTFALPGDIWIERFGGLVHDARLYKKLTLRYVVATVNPTPLT